MQFFFKTLHLLKTFGTVQTVQILTRDYNLRYSGSNFAKLCFSNLLQSNLKIISEFNRKLALDTGLFKNMK